MLKDTQGRLSGSLLARRVASAQLSSRDAGMLWTCCGRFWKGKKEKNTYTFKKHLENLNKSDLNLV